MRQAGEWTVHAQHRLCGWKKHKNLLSALVWMGEQGSAPARSETPRPPRDFRLHLRLGQGAGVHWRRGVPPHPELSGSSTSEPSLHRPTPHCRANAVLAPTLTIGCLTPRPGEDHVSLQLNGFRLGFRALGHLGREGWGQRSHHNSWVTKPFCHSRTVLSSKCPCLVLGGSTVPAGTFSWLIRSDVPITQQRQPHRNT